MLELQNPHSVLAALETRPHDIQVVRLPPRGGGEGWNAVERLAERVGVRIERLERERREGSDDRADGREGGRTGGAVAVVREREPVPLGELFRDPGERGLWLALDGVQDPHNVGAIFRTAAFFGVRGVVTMRDRAAPLSAVVYDVASGGLEVVPFALEVNLRRVLELAKAAGVWIVGSAEQAETAVQDVPRDRPWLLVLGREDQGLRRLTLEHCDVVCGIESRGSLGSLNVSVAAGVLIETLSRP